MTYHDGRSECWPERTLGEALGGLLSGDDLDPTPETLEELSEQEDPLAAFWWDVGPYGATYNPQEGEN